MTELSSFTRLTTGWCHCPSRCAPSMWNSETTVINQMRRAVHSKLCNVNRRREINKKKMRVETKKNYVEDPVAGKIALFPPISIAWSAPAVPLQLPTRRIVDYARLTPELLTVTSLWLFSDFILSLQFSCSSSEEFSIVSGRERGESLAATGTDQLLSSSE